MIAYKEFYGVLCKCHFSLIPRPLSVSHSSHDSPLSECCRQKHHFPEGQLIARLVANVATGCLTSHDNTPLHFTSLESQLAELSPMKTFAVSASRLFTSHYLHVRVNQCTCVGFPLLHLPVSQALLPFPGLVSGTQTLDGSGYPRLSQARPSFRIFRRGACGGSGNERV